MYNVSLSLQKFTFTTLTLAILASLFLFAPVPVHTANDDLLGVEYGEFTGLGERDPRQTIARIIQVALSLLGIIAIVTILYAGFTWMTSGGSEEKIGKAKKTLIAAIIGLAIILSAYAITNFVLRNLYSATTGYEYVGG
jgi:hypothetical protein